MIRRPPRSTLFPYTDALPIWLCRVRVCHVEHGLRGEESLADAAWVEALCAASQVPCRRVTVDVLSLAKREGLSTEEAARNLRHRALGEEAERWEQELRTEAGALAWRGADGGREAPRLHIALAHNANDLAETMLFQLDRKSVV